MEELTRIDRCRLQYDRAYIILYCLLERWLRAVVKNIETTDANLIVMLDPLRTQNYRHRQRPLEGDNARV